MKGKIKKLVRNVLQELNIEEAEKLYDAGKYKLNYTAKGYAIEIVMDYEGLVWKTKRLSRTEFIRALKFMQDILQAQKALKPLKTLGII